MLKSGDGDIANLQRSRMEFQQKDMWVIAHHLVGRLEEFFISFCLSKQSIGT
jgi:hypothetical protein